MAIALVTGSAKRIGKIIAEHLLNAGYQLFLHANTSRHELDTWINHHPHKQNVLDVIEADLFHEAEQNKLIARIKAKTSKVDLLVHNASIFNQKEFSAISRQDMAEMLNINLLAPLFITQGLLNLLKESSSASVVNIIDAMWDRPLTHFAHYAVSKAGLAILTRGLAHELAPQIRVNAIAPGSILFAPFQDEGMKQYILNKIPQKRMGQPHDIAEAVLFLHQAQYINGAILTIDGGKSIAF